MPSRQLSRVNWLLRNVVKPHIGRMTDPAQAEAGFDRASHVFQTPPFVTVYRDADGFGRVQSGPVNARRVLLYLHGGGYVAGGLRSHWKMLGRLSRLAGLAIVVPEYRLAQDAQFPAAYEDALGAWSRLRTLGYQPENIVIGGDSAGGGLALALLSELCARGERPHAVFAMSPWTDLACTGETLAANAQRDPLLPPERIGELVAMYLGDAPRDDPRASPLYARFDAPPPILIQVGSTEILRDDSTRMAESLRMAGGHVTLRVWEATPHVWHLGDGWFPEAGEALKEIADFLQAAFVKDGSESR